MTRTISAQIGLLAFSLATGAGLVARNSATTVLVRALVALVVASLIAQCAAYFARQILRDVLIRTKSRIDAQHLEELKTIDSEAPEPVSDVA
ncbi:MAG: hypothetical protein CHACPFDD_01004 [Phycisphaerae bacterium]|nr:hypothetical protein [Phycisphaerae bacterium]